MGIRQTLITSLIINKVPLNGQRHAVIKCEHELNANKSAPHTTAIIVHM